MDLPGNSDIFFCTENISMKGWRLIRAWKRIKPMNLAKPSQAKNTKRKCNGEKGQKLKKDNSK